MILFYLDKSAQKEAAEEAKNCRKKHFLTRPK